MAQSTNNHAEKIRQTYPDIGSATNLYGKSTTSDTETNTNNPAGEWNSGNEALSFNLEDSCITPPAGVANGDSTSSTDSNSFDINVTQSATIAANKMDATLSVHAKNGKQDQGMIEKIRHQAKFSSCLIFSGTAMQVICLGFLFNDFINNPAALAANPGRQALYGVGLTSGVFTLMTGACFFINDLR